MSSEPISEEQVSKETRNNESEIRLQVSSEQEKVESTEKKKLNLHRDVEKFIATLATRLRFQDTIELENLYESQFPYLSDKFFANDSWPSYESISHIQWANEEGFKILYNQLFYRHLLKHPQPKNEHWNESWKNYCAFFQYFLETDKPRELELPESWLWGIVNEFVYQYQAFCQMRSNLKSKSESEIDELKNNSQVWDSLILLGFLESMVEKSMTKITLEREARNERRNYDSPEYGFDDHPTYKRLGFFCLINLLRIYCLFGDYHGALELVKSVNVNKKVYLTKSSMSHVTLCYYLGFAHLMTQSNNEAVKVFTTGLGYINRFLNRNNSQYEQMKKKSDQIYALLAIALCLQPIRIEESLHSALKERYADKLTKMQRGEWASFEELFCFGCPKFISPLPPNYDERQSNSRQEPLRYQLRIFMTEVKQQMLIPNIRSNLKLYSSIPLSKLAALLEVEEKDVVAMLMAYKHKSRIVGAKSNSPLGDVSFTIEHGMVHITDLKTERRFGEYFLNQIQKLQNVRH